MRRWLGEGSGRFMPAREALRYFYLVLKVAVVRL
jgi:hypothetical protein